MRRSTLLALVPALALGCVVHTTVEHDHLDVPAEGLAALDIDVDAGEVRVTAADNQVITIESVLEWTGSVRPDLDVDPVGDTLHIEGDCPLTHRHCVVDLDIIAPPTFDLTAVTGAGDFVIRDMLGTNELDTGAGDIALRSPAGPTTVSTGAGDVFASDVWALDLEASTGAGAIDLAFSRRPDLVDATSGAGSLSILVPTGAYDIDATTGIGRVTLTDVIDDPRSEHVIVAHTGVGDVDIVGAAPSPTHLPVCTAAEGDPYTITDVRISGDVLEVDAQASGGCAEHDWTLCWPDQSFMESLPVQARLDVLHDDNDDPCDGIFSETVELDLTPLRDAYRHIYADQHATIVVRLGELTAQYVF